MTMRLLFSLFLSALCASLLAQNAPRFFTQISPDAVVLPDQARREFEPLQYAAFSVDYAALIEQLRQAPREHSADAKQRACIVNLPLANGQLEEFVVVKVRTMHPSLETKLPELLTLGGASTRVPGMLVRITVSPYWGIRGMVIHPEKNIEYFQPIALGQERFYMAFTHESEPIDPTTANLLRIGEKPLDFSSFKEESTPRYSLEKPGPDDGELLESPVRLKIYKFAVGCTGEFSQDNGGTKELVFAKVTDVCNKLNAIYERDIDIRLELIAESFDIIFLDPASDPYPGTTVGEWMNANPLAMFNVLGSTSKYDVGHVFARYITGNAIGVAGGLCCTDSKGRGCSAGTGSYGSGFFSVIGQEVGHMWRSGHTFNQCQIDQQFDYDSACEPGSGSTIMSYHGACGSNNISGPAALYYHACSIGEIRNFVENQEGNTCGTEIEVNNQAPVVSTPYPPLMFIPISTPFTLTGSAVDPDGDQLTYCWDEKDLGPTTVLGEPVGFSPLFRWFEPTPSPTRTFPRIQVVVNNSTSKEEVLPDYNRDVTMVLVARDNKTGGGGVGMDTVSMRATTTAGPFLVSYPTLATDVWKVGETQTVLWDVANTNNALVNCQKVNILLSTNGGQTYTVVLAENVPNIGKACVNVPNNAGTQNRVRVEAADNVFFDISNANFKIEQPTTPDFGLCAGTLSATVCLPNSFSTEISVSALAGFSSPVTLTASGLPNGASATFSENPVTPGNSTTLTITFPPNQPETTFDISIQGAVGANTSTSTITLRTILNDFVGLAPTSPANGATGVNPQPLLTWTTVLDADFYDLELASNPSFAPNTIVVSQIGLPGGSYQVSTPLTEGSVYFWRVRGKNDCGTSDWATTQVFVVSQFNCLQLPSNDLPKAIPSSGTPTIESKITILAGGSISDLNIERVQGFHDYFQDLEVHLISPAGTDVIVWKSRCTSFSGNFNIRFDDGASGFFTCPPPNNNSSSKTNNPLSTFNGENSTGTWTLRVKDNATTGGGSLAAFELEICSNEATNPPLIVVNNVLSLVGGTNAIIDAGLLKAEDANNAPSQLVFTLITVPKYGVLAGPSGNLAVGGQFTQADIDNGNVRFYDFGQNIGADEFQFVVSDGEGGMALGTFHVSPIVGTKDLVNALPFDLSPNPAHSVLNLSLGEALNSDALVTVLNAAGQRVGSWSLPAGKTFLSMDVSQFPQGLYAVSVESAQARNTKKIVVK